MHERYTHTTREPDVVLFTQRDISKNEMRLLESPPIGDLDGWRAVQVPTSVWNHYLRALDALDEAQARLDEAKKTFDDSRDYLFEEAGL